MISILQLCSSVWWICLWNLCWLDAILHSLTPKSLHLFQAAYAPPVPLLIHSQDLLPLSQDHRFALEILLGAKWTHFLFIAIYVLDWWFFAEVTFHSHPIVCFCRYFAPFQLSDPASIGEGVNFHSQVTKASPTCIVPLPKTDEVQGFELDLPYLWSSSNSVSYSQPPPCHIYPFVHRNFSAVQHCDHKTTLQQIRVVSCPSLYLQWHPLL